MKKFTKNSTKNLRILNIQGKTILAKFVETKVGSNYTSIDVSSFANGTYILLGLTENGTIFMKN